MFKKKVHLKINKGAKGTTEPAEKLLPGQTSKSESRMFLASDNPSSGS
jgi:hypothetical protein